MNELIKRLFLGRKHTNEAQSKAIQISERLAKALDIEVDSMDDGETLDCYPYIIVRTSRCFQHDWVDLLEISIRGCESPGYANTSNPPWITEKEIGGTTTANVPPDDVVEEVLKIIASNN